jgi:hypothetical protein
MTRHRFHGDRVAIAERLGLTDVATLDRRLLRWSGRAAATRGTLLRRYLTIAAPATAVTSVTAGMDTPTSG